MPDVQLASALGAGGMLLAGGLFAQLRTRTLRRRWRSVGMGLEERATGLASLAAVPVHFPSELETAAATGTQVALVAMRRFTVHPEEFGRRLAAVSRTHEIGWRVDYDLFAVTLVVASRDEAVLAAVRLGEEACDGDTRDLRVGIAMCPEDGTDFLDVVDVAMRRMRGFGLVAAIAGRVRAARGRSALAIVREDVADAV